MSIENISRTILCSAILGMTFFLSSCKCLENIPFESCGKDLVSERDRKKNLSVSNWKPTVKETTQKSTSPGSNAPKTKPKPSPPETKSIAKTPNPSVSKERSSITTDADAGLIDLKTIQLPTPKPPKIEETPADLPPPPQMAKKTEGEPIPAVDNLIQDEKVIKLSVDNANRIIVAGGRDVNFSGNDNVIVLSGGCGRLVLSGMNNQIQCDSVNQIEVMGNGNTLILGTLGGGTIRGQKNNLSWGAGVNGLSPIVESFGADNSMKRLE